MSIESEEENDGLVIPFIVCESEGGPFDDEAFIAGANFGRHHAELACAPGIQVWSEWIVPKMVKQYDLLAMHLGFVMTVEPCKEPGCEEDWVLAVLSRPDNSEES